MKWKMAKEVIIGTKLAGPEEVAEDSTDLQPVSEIHARVSGVAQVNDGVVTITWSDEEHREYSIPAAAHIIVTGNDTVKAGDALTSGPKNPQQILQIQGRESVQNYLIEEVQKVYRSRASQIHDKHIEVISPRCCARSV